MQGASSINRCAMFSTARCVLHLHPQPRVTMPLVRRAPSLTAVSARPRRRGARRNPSWDDDGGGGSGDEDAVDESFFGNPWDEEEPVEPEEPLPSGRRRPAASSELPTGHLRGSDVLRALQRAAAAKEAKKKEKRRSAGARPATRRQEKGGGIGGAKTVEVVGEVRPIEIRREWAPRIQELELRVQHLLDRQHQ